MAVAGRLYIKKGNAVQAAIDAGGNWYFRGDKTNAGSHAHAGLQFRKNGQAVALSVRHSNDPNLDGLTVVENTSTNSPVAPAGSISFKKGNTYRGSLSYSGANGSVNASGVVVFSFATRKNAAHAYGLERNNLRNAFIGIDGIYYPGTFSAADPSDPFPNGGVSHWDKQDEIHQATHVHGGPAFIPWHRELVNRLEVSLRLYDPLVSMHYWDWETDPRSSPDGNGGTVNLFSTGANGFMGSASGRAGSPLDSLDNGNVLAGSREDTGNPADPPRSINRSLPGGAPGIQADTTTVQTGNNLPQADQWPAVRVAIENVHDFIHGYIGGDIGAAHTAFEDPFVYLLHSNVDRLWASWQLKSGAAWRLDPNQVYGSESAHSLIVDNLEPWSGTTLHSSGTIRPWTAPENQMVLRNCKHPSVVHPPRYDAYVPA